MIITEEQIVNNGLNWVRGFDKFMFEGGHWYPYPEVLRSLVEYNIDTVYKGHSENGTAISTFTRKPTEQQRLEVMEEELVKIENKYGIKILEWNFV